MSLTRQLVTVRQADVILWVALAGLTAVGAAQYSRNPMVADEVVKDTYFSPDSGEIKLLGVCDIISSPVRCWSGDRRTDPDLAKQVADLLAAKDRHQGTTDPEIRFQFRHKSRVAVFQYPAPVGGSPYTSNLAGFYTVTGNYLSSVKRAWEDKPHPQLDLIALNAEGSLTATSIFASLSCPVGRSLFIPAVEDATASSGSRTVNIASIKPDPSPVLGFPPNQKGWSFLLKIVGDSPTSRLQVTVEPVDAKGATILRVDLKGRPAAMPGPGTTPQEWREVARTSWPVYYSSPSKYLPELGGRTWTSRIDPKYISNLRVSFAVDRCIEFRNVPLDPKK